TTTNRHATSNSRCATKRSHSKTLRVMISSSRNNTTLMTPMSIRAVAVNVRVTNSAVIKVATVKNSMISTTSVISSRITPTTRVTITVMVTAAVATMISGTSAVSVNGTATALAIAVVITIKIMMTSKMYPMMKRCCQFRAYSMC